MVNGYLDIGLKELTKGKQTANITETFQITTRNFKVLMCAWDTCMYGRSNNVLVNEVNAKKLKRKIYLVFT